MTNSQQIEDLAWAIEASGKEFKLILAKCNYINLQNQLIQELQEICQVEIKVLRLQTSERTLYHAIREEFEQEIAALMIVGWESLPNLSQMFSSANQVREEFRNNCKYPVVLWINDEIYQQIMESAADLESWGITINFILPLDKLINLLKSIIDKILNDNLNINLQELELALQDLQKYGQDLETEFQANCNLLRGFIEYNKKQLDTAINYYQKSLGFWTTTDNLEIQGKILYNLTICNYEKFITNPTVTNKREDIKNYLQQTLEKFKNAQHLDLIANSLSKFGLILQDLREWGQLKKLAAQALEIHQAENNILKVAEDCIFLAIATFEQLNFQEAAKIANQGLEVLNTIHQSESGANYYQGLLLILAQAQEKLQQYEQAIINLRLAINIGVINNQPKLYVKILNLLQQLLFTQKEYLEAFNTKLESRSIEQQFGLRAFIGAGWLKPSKNTSFVNKENIALEIEASGRKIDVDKLLESIGRNDKKIIVIHGQSGVGKSSLVNAGLIPALENKAIGFKDNLPVTIRVYNSWFTELKKELLDVLPEKLKSEKLKLDTQEEFISQLVEIEKNNLRTVLIFDQFEEFFFVYSDDKARTEFFQFLGKCLDKNKNIGSLRVILSLRVDYLHLLLECDEITDMNIVGDGILSKNVLYKLGNLTPENAKTTIQRLTKKTIFRLEPDLINLIVEDLAGKLGSVRPIELQVVGAQLETENITALAAYKKCGNKQQLVKRYLAEIVNDCGGENQEIAELLLYFLTDEQGTRPLKTKAELESDLQSLLAQDKAENNLDLVLEIFVKSGLVVFLPENPCERYQLVHDYLALFIRQQQEPKLMAELEKERKQRQLTEAELKQAEAAKNILTAANKKAKQRIGISSGVMTISLVLGTIAAVLATQASRLSYEAQTGSRLERQGITAWQQFEKYEIEPLLSAMAAGQELQKLVKDGRPLENYPAASPQLALQTILANIHEKNQLKGHTSYVRNANFSPDGKTIVTASYDNTARVWDLSGKQIAELKGHTSSVNNASFSPDGKTIVTASDDNTARVWDLSGKQLAELKGHTSSVNNASFSPDGKTIVTASYDNTARVWDLSGKQLAELKGHTSPVYNASFSSDGKTIVTASDDNTARVWDLSGKQLAELKGHTSSVNNASFSPDGKIIVTASGDIGSKDNTARVWDLSGKQLAELKGHTSSVNNASFSPDGKTIVTASDDNTARVWDLSGKQIAELKEHTSRVINASFSPDGKTIVTASDDNTARVWDLSGKQIAELKGHTSAVYNASFSPDGKTIVTASDDNTARVWDLSSKQIAELKGHTSAVYNASFSPDGKTIVTASGDNTARVWDSSGKQIAELKGHTNGVNNASFSPDGKTIVTASGDNVSEDNTARVWDLSGKQIAELKGHTSRVINASFSPDGKTIVTASWDNTARVWDLSGKQIAELKGHTSRVINASFSPDGKTIVTASWDNTARVWDLSGKQIAELKGHTSGVYNAGFNPDGKTIVTASDDNTARVWDLSGKQIAELKGHTSTVYNASFSPDGKTIVTASYDNTARVWRADNLDKLLSRGCEWLNDYLVINPKDLEKLQVCQNQSNLTAAAPFLVKVGEEKARTGNIENAVATFQTALKWNLSLQFDPQAKAQEFASKGKAERLVTEGESLVKQDKIKEAIAAYTEAQRLDSQVEISADSWAMLCWQGSLKKQVGDVMFACEKAIKLKPNNINYRLVRGLARALSGNYPGAIEDFETYIQWTGNEKVKEQLQGWVKVLKTGKNPFTDAELKKLLNPR